jgi:hypothetical protein
VSTGTYCICERACCLHLQDKAAQGDTKLPGRSLPTSRKTRYWHFWSNFYFFNLINVLQYYCTLNKCTTADKYSIKYYEIFTVIWGPRIPSLLIKNLRFETCGKLTESFLKKSHSAGQDMPDLICNLKFHHNFHRNSPKNTESNKSQ